MRPFSVLQQYVLREVIRVFLFVLLVNTVLMVFVGVFQQANEWNMSIGLIAPLLPYIIPSLLPFTIPATLLLSITIVYGRIASDREVVAIKAAGISPMAMLLPGLAVGALLSVVTFLLMDVGIPWSARRMERAVFSMMDDIVLEKLRSSHYLHYWPARIEISVAGVQERRLILPVFRYSGSGGRPVTLQATEAELRFDKETDKVIFSFRDAILNLPSRDGAAVNRVRLNGEKEISLPLPSSGKARRSYHLTIQEIIEEVDVLATTQERNKRQDVIAAMMFLTKADFEGIVRRHTGIKGEPSEQRIWKLRTERYNRMALSCSCLAFVLLGAPLAVIQAKGHYLTSFILCFIPIICIYYPVVLGVILQCEQGLMEPIWAVWIGNALTVVVSYFLFRRVLRY
ncbi:MAG: LptF/LptG family permease [Planctomycetaceae bacterium]|nr:LptF/LptG family permease [Planctomycetaceae bacterium]